MDLVEWSTDQLDLEARKLEITEAVDDVVDHIVKAFSETSNKELLRDLVKHAQHQATRVNVAINVGYAGEEFKPKTK